MIKKKILKIDGMTCQHCVNTVTETVTMIIGVERVEVNLEEKNAIIEYEESQVQLEKISKQIIEAGFEVEVVDS